ncbi:MAG: AMP-dependent synthetase/ligase [Acidobacteriota bacterium]
MAPPIRTLNELLHRYLTAHPRDDAVGYLDQDRIRWMSTAQVAERIRALSLGLRAMGVEPGDRVALLSENRWEWMAADFGILAAGAVTVPLHPGLTAKQMAYVLADSAARVALVSTPSLTAQMLAARRDVPSLETIIAFDGPEQSTDHLLPLRVLLDRGRAHGESHPGAYRATRDRVRGNDLASLIYTSGTTGDPKGVMLTHANFGSNVTSCCSVFDFAPTDRALSFLPLCHVFERTVDYCYYYSGCRVIHLPELSQLAPALIRVRPTVFAAVPRLYEKMFIRIQEGVPVSRRGLFDWAVKVGIRTLERRLAGRVVGPWLALRHLLAERLVFRRVRAGLGGNLRFTVSGGAPLAPDLAAFFLGAGITVLEGYGLTESSPVITTNRPGSARPGTVGPPLPGVEVRVDGDGEILTRGPHVMKGYWKAPQLTAEAIDADGWLHTGDLGRMESNGHLVVTDRKKEIIVTAQGKNISPQPLENALRSQPLISQAVVVGDRRPYLVALIVPDGTVLGRMAAELGLAQLERRELLRHPAVMAAVEQAIQKATAGFAHHEQVRRFALLDREFSREEGEMTAVLKIKRRVIERRFAATIEGLYTGHATPHLARA